MKPEEPVLNPEEVAGVLSGVDGDATAESKPEPPDGPIPYSLREPVAIPPQAEAEARRRLEGWTLQLAEAFQGVLGEAFGMKLDNLQQQRVSAALSVLPAPRWTLPMVHPEGGGLALALAGPVGLALVERILGGEGRVPEEGRAPTRLEARILERIIGECLARQKEGALAELRPGPLQVDELDPRVAAPGETVAVGLLRLRLGEAEHSAVLLASPSRVLGAGDDAGPEPTAPGALAGILCHVPVRVRPVLRVGRVALRQLEGVGEGDLIHFDVPETAPLELRVQDEPIFRGHIRRTDTGAEFHVTRRRGGPQAGRGNPDFRKETS